MRYRILATCAAACLLIGCIQRPEITALPASPFNRCEPPGMPFYLPKPLLVVAKNVRHIDEAKVGLTDPAPIPNGFDDQASYADIKANVTVPGKTGGNSLAAATNTGDRKVADQFDETAPGIPEGWRGEMTPKGRIKDGLAPDSFYTYQIVFVPDLGQKYGLTIKGNPGEVRAAMNLVNGWMYTGMGPYYLKDSSSAQNIMATGVASMFVGRGVSDVLDSVSGLASAAGGGSGRAERAMADSDLFVDRVLKLSKIMQSQTLVPCEMLNYAEVAIYEPELAPDGSMVWTPIAQHTMDRHYFSPDMDKGMSDLLQGLIQELAKPNKQQRQPGGSVDSDVNNGGGNLDMDPPRPQTGGDTMPGIAPSETVPAPEPDADAIDNLGFPKDHQGAGLLQGDVNAASRSIERPAPDALTPVILAPEPTWLEPNTP